MRLDIAADAKARFVRLIDFDRLDRYIDGRNTVVVAPVLHEIVDYLLFLCAELYLISFNRCANGGEKQHTKNKQEPPFRVHSQNSLYVSEFNASFSTMLRYPDECCGL